MSSDVIRELQIVQKMLSALLKHQSLSQWCDCIAFGENEGGVYVALFNSKAAFRIGVVYSEQFKKLPDYIRLLVPDNAAEIGTERQRVEKAGHLISVPGFLFTRYKLNPDEPQDRWRFGDVLFASSAPETAQPAPEQQKQPQTASNGAKPSPKSPQAPEKPPADLDNPPLFAGPADAISWGVDTGVFVDYAASKAAYEALKKKIMPGSAKEMFAAWVARVQELALWQKA